MLIVRSQRPRPATGLATAALGALAVGAIAIGVFAIGRLAVGRLAVGTARLRRAEIGELTIDRLRIKMLLGDEAAASPAVAVTKPAISDEAAIGDDPESRGDPYVGSAK